MLVENLVNDLVKALGIMEEHQNRLYIEREKHGWETHVKQAVSYTDGEVIINAVQHSLDIIKYLPGTSTPIEDNLKDYLSERLSTIEFLEVRRLLSSITLERAKFIGKIKELEDELLEREKYTLTAKELEDMLVESQTGRTPE